MTEAKKMTAEQLLALPTAVDVVTAGLALGIARTKAYALAKAGEFPVPVMRVGNRYRVSTTHLLKVLGVDIERARREHTDDTHSSACNGEAGIRRSISSDEDPSRKLIKPDKYYRIRATGEFLSGAEVLKRRRAAGAG